jgi:hypothetical protein
MEFTIQEGLQNGSNILSDLAKAVGVGSDGGAKITMSELTNIIIQNGIKIVEDVQDVEPVV